MMIQLCFVAGLAAILSAHGLEEQNAPPLQIHAEPVHPSSDLDSPPFPAQNNGSSPLPSHVGLEEAGKLQPQQDSDGSILTRRGKLGFNALVFYSQSTIITVTTRTVSSIVTCVSTGPAASCTGRRRKRASLIKELPLSPTSDDDSSLHGSSNVEVIAQPIEKIDRRTGKRVTVWSTVFSTLTLATTLSLSGTTVTVSAVCNNVGGTALVNTCFLG